MSTEQPFLRLAADSERPLRGGCHCGRNRYVIDIPEDAREEAQVLFKTHPVHQISLANPLPAFLRVPLAWYRSSTHAVFDDETASTIHRIYSPSDECAQNRFCGFCGTPLTYWCENPISEADYILVTLGSLDTDDLRDLDDLGLVTDSDESESEEEAITPERKPRSSSKKESTGIPWLDELMQAAPKAQRGTEKTPTHTHIVHEKETTDGTFRVEWEITEWNDDPSSESHDDVEGMAWTAHSHGKRKLQDLEDSDRVV